MKQGTLHPEKRKSIRFKARVRLLFSRSETANFINAETNNISPAGIYIKTRRRPLKTGTKVSLLLNLDGVDKELMISGVVVWHSDTSDQKTGESGMGIRFLEGMDTETQETLYGALERYESEGF